MATTCNTAQTILSTPADITGTLFGVRLAYASDNFLQPLEGPKGLALCVLALVKTSALVKSTPS